jgi:hypothetical protein
MNAGKREYKKHDLSTLIIYLYGTIIWREISPKKSLVWRKGTARVKFRKMFTNTFYSLF